MKNTVNTGQITNMKCPQTLDKEKVSQAFHILNNFDIPLG